MQKTVYATEPVMHGGEVFLPGQSMDCDENEAFAIIGSGRGTQDADVAAAAKKQYAAAQKAAADAQAATASVAADSAASVNAAATQILQTLQGAINTASAPAAK